MNGHLEPFELLVLISDHQSTQIAQVRLVLIFPQISDTLQVASKWLLAGAGVQPLRYRVFVIMTET